MKHFFVILFAFVMLNPLYAQGEREAMEFLVLRLDYQSDAVKHLYHFKQPIDMASIAVSDRHYHGLDVKIVPAGDFGGTTIRSSATGKVVYEATTVWNGTGKHIFPTPELEIATGNLPIINKEPMFYDVVSYFFGENDDDHADQVWRKAKNLQLPFTFAADTEYGALLYLHYFSVGMSDPTSAEWIVILYSLPHELSPYLRYRWVNVSNNLTNTFINSVAPHSFFGDTLWIGTNSGAFQSVTGGNFWEPVNFGDNRNVKVTTVITVPNPFVNSLCSVVGLGTEDLSVIPEQRNGRIFRSWINGSQWDFTKSPNIAVTTIVFNPLNPYTMYAGLFNPFTKEGGLYRLKKNGDWEKIKLIYGASEPARINCITIDEADTSAIYVGTAQGIYFTHDNSQSWNYTLGSFNISSIIAINRGKEKVIYASTNGRSKSDGIYMSRNLGKNWEVIHWRVNIIALVSAKNRVSISPVERYQFYMSVCDEGVFESYDQCRTWYPINTGLTEKKVTSLAVHPSKFRQLYLGTENGIFKYTPYFPQVDLAIADDDLAYWPPHPKDNELVEIYATVHNRSPFYLFNIEVSFVDNADGMLTVIVPIDTLIIPYMLPYSEYTLRAEWYPQNQQGYNKIFAEVDPRNRIRETDENNNLASIDIYLEEPPYKRKWVDISKDLPNTFINDIAAHPFNRGEIYVATNKGAFESSLSSRHWLPLKFHATYEAKITQIVAEMHPYLDWTVPVLWLGTEEYSNIPEDRLGRVFMSADGGDQWWNTEFPRVAVSAIEPLPSNSLNVFAASYNPFYYIDDFYALVDSTWIGFDLTPKDTIANRINCFAFDAPEKGTVYIGTQSGLYITRPDAAGWRKTLDNLNVVSLVVPEGFRCKIIYAATRGESFCDGIYKSMNNGETWQKIGSFKNIVSLAAAANRPEVATAAPHFYLALYGQGILESRNGGFSWTDITLNLTDKEFVSLAVDRMEPEIAYVGTKKSIYYFDDPPTEITANENEISLPTGFYLNQNYPNPFNSSTVITYHIPAEAVGEKGVLRIYNALGQEVKTFYQNHQMAGVHQLEWDGHDRSGIPVNSGIYFCRLSYGKYSAHIKLVYLK